MENSEKKQPQEGETNEKYSPVAYLIMLFTAAIVLVILSYFVYEGSAGSRDTGFAHQYSEMHGEQTGGNPGDVE